MEDTECSNGPFDTNLTGGFPTNSDYGDSALKLLTPNLSVSDYFTPFDQQTAAATDTDLGSGAAVVLPDISDTTGTIHHFLLAAGKDSRLYLLDRNNLGKFNSGGDLIYQELPAGTLPGGTWSSAAYFNNSVYLGSQGNSIQQFQFDFTNLTKPLTKCAFGICYWIIARTSRVPDKRVRTGTDITTGLT